MSKISIRFDDAHAVNLAKIERLARETGVSRDEYAAALLIKQIDPKFVLPRRVSDTPNNG